MKLIIWHLEAVRRLDGKNIECRTAIDEGLGDKDVADDGRAKHREGADSCRALELVGGVKGDGALGPLERASCFRLGELCIHLARKLLEDMVGSRGL